MPARTAQLPVLRDTTDMPGPVLTLDAGQVSAVPTQMQTIGTLKQPSNKERIEIQIIYVRVSCNHVAENETRVLRGNGADVMEEGRGRGWSAKIKWRWPGVVVHA